MSSPTVTRSGRCSRCLGYADSPTGCTRCWSHTKSDAAHMVLTMEEPALPELITAYVSEEQIPVFQSLLRPPGPR